MELKLQAEARVKNEKLSADFIPAVLYGKGITSQSLKIKKIDFDKIFALAGESNLIDLNLGADSVKVLVKDLQRDVIKNYFTHVDFYQVNMKEKITAEIPLHFKGESKAIKELGGMLMKEVHELTVECLPSDLVDHLDAENAARFFEKMVQIADVQTLVAGVQPVYGNINSNVIIHVSK